MPYRYTISEHCFINSLFNVVYTYLIKSLVHFNLFDITIYSDIGIIKAKHEKMDDKLTDTDILVQLMRIKKGCYLYLYYTE